MGVLICFHKKKPNVRHAGGACSSIQEGWLTARFVVEGKREGNWPIRSLKFYSITFLTAKFITNWISRLTKSIQFSSSFYLISIYLLIMFPFGNIQPYSCFDSL